MNSIIKEQLIHVIISFGYHVLGYETSKNVIIEIKLVLVTSCMSTKYNVLVYDVCMSGFVDDHCYVDHAFVFIPRILLYPFIDGLNLLLKINAWIYYMSSCLLQKFVFFCNV